MKHFFKKVHFHFLWIAEISQRWIDRPWYPVWVGLMALADFWVLVIPLDWIWATSCLGKKNRVVWSALCVSTGSALGALSMDLAIEWGANIKLDAIVAKFSESQTLMRVDDMLRSHGVWALVVAALLPLPLQPAVAIASLSDMAHAEVFGAIWCGRMIKYLGLGFGLRRFKSWGKRFLVKHGEVEQ